MSIVDTRVVKMIFDNSGFEANAGTTLDTISKLKSSLNFDGAIAGLQNIGTAAKDISLSTLSNNVITVKQEFDALGIMAKRVLEDIVDDSLKAGKSLLSNLTIDPIKSGLEEYETQINSVQTILANTGDKLKEQGLTTEHDRIEKINGVLDELNHYADMTIYNFTEMTRNIGTFTAAGVELDTAATAIQGIANLAAMSGSNSQQASTAMYQLSQALASGSVKLQDWNSVVNAGMGGKLFQNELIETAKAMKVEDENFQALVNDQMSFRESLSTGWITDEVLINTLEKFTAGTEGYTHAQVESMKELWRARGYSEEQIKDLTGSLHELTATEEENLREKWAQKGFDPQQIDHILEMGSAATDAATKVKTLHQLIDTLKEALQSGWTQSWEYVFGDFEQAKAFWTEISDIMNVYIGKSADARNEILEAWSKATYAYNEDGKLILAESGELVEDQRMISEIMGGRELIIQGLRNAFQGVFEILLKIGEAWDESFLGKGTDNDISITAKQLIDLSYQFEEFTKRFKNSLIDAEGNATPKLQAIKSTFDVFFSALRTAFNGATDIFSGVINIGDALFHSEFFKLDFLNSLAAAVTCVADGFAIFGESFNKHFGSENAANREGLMIFFGSLQGILESAIWTKLTFIESAWLALGSVFDKLVEPFGTFSNLLGVVGNYITIFVQAFDIMTHTAEGGSKIAEFFQALSADINSFIDTIRNNIDFSPFKDLFTSIINTMTSDKVDLFGSLENVIFGITNVLKGLASVILPIATAFAEVLSPAIEKIGLFLNDVTTRFREFTESLIANEPVMTGIHELFVGIFSVIEAVGEVLGSLLIKGWDALAAGLSGILPPAESVGDILTKVGTTLSNFADKIRGLVGGESSNPLTVFTSKMQVFSDTVHKIVPGLEKDAEDSGTIFSKFTEKFSGFVDNLKNLGVLDTAKTIVTNFFSGIKQALFGTDEISMLDGMVAKISDILERVKTIFTKDDGSMDSGKVLAGGGIMFVIMKAIEFVKGLFDTTSGISGIVQVIKDIGEAITDTFGSIQEWLKVDALSSIARALLEMAGAIFVIAMIDPVSLATAMGAIAALFKLIENLLQGLALFDKKDVGKLLGAAGAIQTLGNAILEMAAAVFIMGSMNPEDMVRGLLGVMIMIGALTKVAEEFSKFEKDLPAGAMSLVLFAAALDLLTIPVVILGNMEWDKFAQGMLGTVSLMLALAGAAFVLSKSGLTWETGAALVMFAKALGMIGEAVLAISVLNLGQIGTALAGLMAPLAALFLITKFTKASDMLTTGEGIAAMAAGLYAIGQAILLIANLELAQIGTALLGLCAPLAAFYLIAKNTDGLDMVTTGLGILAMSAAMVPLAGALLMLSNLNFGQVCTGLFALGGALVILGAASVIFTPTMVATLTALAGALALIGAAMLAFGAGLFLLGAAISGSGSLILLFLEQLIGFLPKIAVGLVEGIGTFFTTIAEQATNIAMSIGNFLVTVLGILGPMLLPMIFEFIRTLLSQVMQTVTELAPQFFEMLSTVFASLWTFIQEQIPHLFDILSTLLQEVLTFIQENYPMIVETISVGLQAILQAIQTNAPIIGQTLLTLLHTILQVIQTAIPDITNTLLSLLTQILAQLTSYIPAMADLALKLIGGFLDAIAKNIGKITQSAFDIIIAFMDALAEKTPELVESAFKLLIAWIEGLADAIDKHHDELWDAVGHLIESLVEAILDGLVKIGETAGKIIDKFIETFNLSDTMQKIGEAGANLVQGLINGITGGITGIVTSVGDLAGAAWDTLTGAWDEHSPSKLAEGAGMNFALGASNGIANGISNVEQSSSEMALAAMSTLDSEFENYQFSPDLQPTISPVLDSSEIQNGMEDYQIDGNMLQKIDLNLSYLIDNQNALLEHLFDDWKAFTDQRLMMLSGQFTDINNAMKQGFNDVSNMRVVLDSGTLVGELTPGIDENLGSAAALYRRGVV